MTKKYLIILLFVLLASCGLSQTAKVSAHRDGCHRWHSCPSDTGSYVCGDLGYYSECPGGAPASATPQTTAPAPHIPVVTKKIVSSDESIPFKTIVTTNAKEYPSYEVLKQAGQNGLRRSNTEVTYTDGVETGRAPATSEVVTPAVDQVTVKGSRTIPSAKIQLHQTKKKDRYDITGSYRPNSTVVLAVDGKRIKRAKTNAKGEFIYKQVKLNKDSHTLEIFSRAGRKETKISEKYFVKPKKHTLTTEYNQDHGKNPATF